MNYPLIFSSLLLLSPLPVLGSDLDAPGAPSVAGSAMHTLKDVCQRLDNGAAGVKRTGGFTEPTAGPGSTDCTIDEIMEKAPATDTDAAVVGDVAKDKKFWGLKAGAWGLQTGTQETKTLSDSNDTVAAGIYTATTLSTVDTDLKAENIKSGTSIFGVTGTLAAPPEPSCICSGTMNGTRWCDNGDGTVTDLLGNSTNYNEGKCLIWLQKANCSETLNSITPSSGELNWLNAIRWSTGLKSGFCGLASTETSTEGDWRLPSKTELEGITKGTEGVLNSTQRAFSAVQTNNYWSSSTYADDASNAWYLNLLFGLVSVDRKTNDYYVWPVRGGQ